MANDKRTEVLHRLRELKAQHEAALGERPQVEESFIQDEQITRKSYRLVAADALADGVLTREDLRADGLPEALEQADYL